MFEHRSHPLISKAAFRKRVWRHLARGGAVLAAALGIGTAGYHFLGELSWLDALLNASMILGGMGPVDPLRQPVAKLFASFYALFSGLVFIGVASLLVAPFVHRFLHRFHLEEKDAESDADDGEKQDR